MPPDSLKVSDFNVQGNSLIYSKDNNVLYVYSESLATSLETHKEVKEMSNTDEVFFALGMIALISWAIFGVVKFAIYLGKQRENIDSLMIFKDKYYIRLKEKQVYESEYRDSLNKRLGNMDTRVYDLIGKVNSIEQENNRDRCRTSSDRPSTGPTEETKS